MEDLSSSSRDGEKKSFGYKGKKNLAMEDFGFRLKGKSSFTKKDTQNQLASQIIQNTLEKKHLKIHQRVEKKKVLVLMERRSLKVEVTDLKALPSKNTVKKELKSKTF